MAAPASQWHLEPVAQGFVESLGLSSIAPIHSLASAEARATLLQLQSGAVGRPVARMEKVTFPLKAGGIVGAYILRPMASEHSRPAILYFHGGGWVLGDVHTHGRLIREICVGTGAAVVFVDMSRAPEARYPVALQEAYEATCYVARHGASLNLDGSRLAVVGDCQRQPDHRLDRAGLRSTFSGSVFFGPILSIVLFSVVRERACLERRRPRPPLA